MLIAKQLRERLALSKTQAGKYLLGHPNNKVAYDLWYQIEVRDIASNYVRWLLGVLYKLDDRTLDKFVKTAMEALGE